MDALFSYIHFSVQNEPKILVKISGVNCSHENGEVHVNVRPQLRYSPNVHLISILYIFICRDT